MKLCPVEAELFHADRWTNRRTDMSKLIVAFRNFVNAPKNEYKVRHVNNIQFILYNTFLCTAINMTSYESTTIKAETRTVLMNLITSLLLWMTYISSRFSFNLRYWLTYENIQIIIDLEQFTFLYRIHFLIKHMWSYLLHDPSILYKIHISAAHIGNSTDPISLLLLHYLIFVKKIFCRPINKSYLSSEISALHKATIFLITNFKKLQHYS